MLKQYLGTHKITFGKDKEAEENEKAVPDRKAIQAYLHGLKNQRSRGSPLDDNDNEEEEEEEEEDMEDKDGEDYTENFQKTKLKNVSVSLLVCTIFQVLLNMVNRKNLQSHCYQAHRRKW